MVRTRTRLGFDSVAQAMSGAMSLTGFEGAPIRSIVPFEDYGTALHTAFGVMVALYHRAKTGEGQVVDGSLLATGVTFMQALLAERAVLAIERTQRGNAGFYSAPADCYRDQRRMDHGAYHRVRYVRALGAAGGARGSDRRSTLRRRSARAPIIAKLSPQR